MTPAGTDRPIIFSAPMVRALLEGRKTMTRRLTPSHLELAQPGDSLWVRESWRPGAWRGDDEGGRIAVDYRASPEENRTPWLRVPPASWRPLWLKLGDEAEAAACAGRGSTRRNSDGDGWTWDRGDSPCAWRPSIHMPRWASRLTLTVAAVRVEPLQAISDEDAAAEGVAPRAEAEPIGMAAYRFRELWDSLHGPDAWDANPEVVALSFVAKHRNIDEAPRA